MRKDDHLIFEALQSGKGVVVAITDHVVDEQEGTAEPGYYPFKTTIKQFDAKHVAHALIKHAYGKLDQDRVEAALQSVLDAMTVNPYGAKPGIIELHIDEFPTDGMVHQVEAKIVNKAEDAESADERKERTQRKWQMNKNRWAKWKMENPEAAAKHAAKKQGKSENAEETAEQRIAAVKQAVAQAKGQIAQAKTQGHMKHYGDGLAKALGKSENAENEPHGYPQGITAIQNVLINQLKKHGFTLTKISHADKDRDKYPTVFMKKSQGAMHIGAEIDGMGYINGEPFKEYMMVRGYDAKNAGNKPYTPSGARPDPEDPAYDTWQSIAQDHAGEDAESYSAMMHLTQAANEIRDILQTHADDEAQVDHIIKMAQIILGPKSDHTDAEYRKMLDGLIVILNRFIVVPMN